MICGNNRIIDISLGPEYYFSLQNNNYIKENNILICNTEIKIYGKIYEANLRINCDNNTFSFDRIRGYSDEKSSSLIRQNKEYYFYFNSYCHECKGHSSATKDSILYLNNKIIKYLELEEEHLRFKYKNNLYNFLINYYTNEISVSINSKKSIQFPFMNYDFSDKEKLYHKIQTIITFG